MPFPFGVDDNASTCSKGSLAKEHTCFSSVIYELVSLSMAFLARFLVGAYTTSSFMEVQKRPLRKWVRHVSLIPGWLLCPNLQARVCKERHGRGSAPMVSHFGVAEFTTHFRTYLSGDCHFSGWIESDVYWGYGVQGFDA